MISRFTSSRACGVLGRLETALDLLGIRLLRPATSESAHLRRSPIALSARRSVEERSFLALRMMIVRPGRVTSPEM